VVGGVLDEIVDERSGVTDECSCVTAGH
jgi:hypothetical protein